MKRKLRNLILCLCLAALLATTVFGAQVEAPYTKEALLSALYEADIATARRAIAEGVVTCEELTAYYLQRISAYNEPYNCFITLCDNALEVARQRDEALAAGGGEGLLFGIPVVVKDNIHYEGFYTTNGYSFEYSGISDSNAYVVERLLAEGAVIIAKANMSFEAESARESTSYSVGETKNAYNPLLVAGGSSGGSAVAVSLNFAMAGLGTDTNSSLRIPAVLNGCISLRPTTGMITMDGIFPVNTTRDIPGAITRTMQDQAIMLDVLTEGIYNFTGNLKGKALEGLRLGIIEELLNEDHPGTDPEILVVFNRSVAELEACGAEVIRVSMPDLIYLSDETFYSDARERKEDLLAAYRALLEEENLDAVIYPGCTSAPIKSGTDENGTYWDAYAQEFLNNSYVIAPSAMVPAIALPIGYHSLGAGIGMEIAADQGQEQLLLDIAYSYTLQYDHRIAPGGAPDDYRKDNRGELAGLIDDFIAAREAATAPTTEPTEPTVEPTAEPTVPPTQPPATEPAKPQGNIWQWLVPVCAVLLVLDIGALVWVIRNRPRRRKKHRYDK